MGTVMHQETKKERKKRILADISRILDNGGWPIYREHSGIRSIIFSEEIQIPEIKKES